MIKSLRIRFIAASMLALILVLSVILGGLNYTNYRKTILEADAILTVLAENGGKFPNRMASPEFRSGEKRRDKNQWDPYWKPRDFSPETPFENRFFSVGLNATGEVLSIDTGMVASVDQETAIDCAQKVFASGTEQGFLGNYRYCTTYFENELRIIFLDCSRSLSFYRATLQASIAIAAAGLGAVLILLTLFSARIIKPIAESYEKQKRFITDAGHELKTPLTVIQADADLVEMECGENEWLTDIRRQAHRLTELTNELIALSRMDEEKPVLQTIEFPLSDVVEETAESFLGLAAQQGKQLKLSIQPMLSFCGDEKAIRKLVSILLDNAVKYSSQNGEIRLTLERKSKQLYLAVENSLEQPMSKAQLDAMFDRFYRTDASRSSRVSGYGLGLSIAKSIVTAHKGKIRAQSPEETKILITAVLPE